MHGLRHNTVLKPTAERLSVGTRSFCGDSMPLCRGGVLFVPVWVGSAIAIPVYIVQKNWQALP